MVYDYLYKFSFERLQAFLEDPVMILFFYRMLKTKGTANLQTQTPISTLAEQEACLLMLKYSCFDSAIGEIYDK